MLILVLFLYLMYALFNFSYIYIYTALYFVLTNPGLIQQEITTNTAIKAFLASSNSSSGSSLCDSSSESPRIRMTLSPSLGHLTPGPQSVDNSRPRSMSVGNTQQQQQASLASPSSPSKVQDNLPIKATM